MPTNTCGGKWLRDVTRLRVYARDGWRCLWCTRHVHGRAATVDHFLPRSARGSNAHDNIFTACRRCNSQRGALPALDYAYRAPLFPDFEALERIFHTLGRPLPTHVP